MSDARVLVVGGGISGLAAAWWLSRLGVAVELWEASERAGGKIRTHRGGRFVTEEAASLVMRFRPEVDALVDGLGLAAARLACRPATQRYLVSNARLAAVPMRLGAMIASPLWSWRGKLRLLAEPFIGRGARDDESVTEFVTRRLGREVLERAMEPYLAGPLASDPDLAEARSVLPRLTALERRYGSLTAGVVARRAMRRRSACAASGFGFRAGMSTLVDALAAGLGPRLRLGRRVVAIEPARDGWRVVAQTAVGETETRARHVVLTGPADASARLLARLDPELSNLLEGIAYAPVGVVHLGFDRDAVGHPLDGTGFLVPRAEGGALTGCLWASSLFPGRAAPGQALLTCYVGGARAPAAVARNDAGIVSAVLGELRPLLGLRADPTLVRVHRHARALPLYHGAHRARLDAIERRAGAHPGLHLAGNYGGGVSVQDRIAAGRELAARIAEDPAAAPLRARDARAAHPPHPLEPRPAIGV